MCLFVQFLASEQDSGMIIYMNRLGGHMPVSNTVVTGIHVKVEEVAGNILPP